VVSDWVEAANAIEEEENRPGQDPPRAVQQADAQTALAIFEAVNGIDRRYESYLGFPRAADSASQEAAAATAAHAVLNPELLRGEPRRCSPWGRQMKQLRSAATNVG
jgi:hypothetical protein